MVSFCIKVCEIVIEVNCFKESTKRICSKYLCDSKPEISITIGETRRFETEFLELHYLITEKLASRGIMLIHGSAISMDGEAYIFIAPSGTGKSTHTALWRELFGDRVVMINDDKPYIKVNPNGECLVYGSPWDGKHKLSTNISVPLKAICCLNRGTENTIKEITIKEALPNLLKQSYQSDNAQRESDILTTLNTIALNTKFYSLNCNTQVEAATISYNGMK